MPNTRNEWTVLSMLEWATSYFDEKGVKSSRLSIEWLLAYVLNIKRLDLYLKYDRPLTSDELAELRPLVKRRAGHEPLQYITGEAEFFNSILKVNSEVLIPRQETEQLVQLICEENKGTGAISVLDIGTGSGCIPISLKKEFKSWNVFGIDISDGALSLAKENASINEVEVHFLKHDLFDPDLHLTENKFDIIISNPPYILQEEKNGLDKEVKDFEPHLALFCKSTIEMFSSIENFCAKNLKKNGVIYLEIHEDYSGEVLDIFIAQNWNARTVQDLDKKDRFVVAQRS